MKSIAIIITAYKTENFILETIESLKKQFLPESWNYKLYIGVDDCEDTANILEKNQISYYYSHKNVGTYVLSNSLLKEAKDKNDIFLRFDSDDIARENFLLYGIQHTKNYKFVRSSFSYCDELGKPKKSKIKKSHGSVFMSKEILEKLGGYNHFRVGCDTDLIKRAEALECNDKITADLPLYYYRQLSNSLSNSLYTGKNTKYRSDIVLELDKKFKQGIIKIENPITTKLVYNHY